MTVKEVYDNMDDLTDEQREEHLLNLSKQFCKVSIGELQTFQNNWDYTKANGMAAFFAEQAKIIKKCINLEISDFGRTVRATLGLEPLTWETEI